MVKGAGRTHRWKDTTLVPWHGTVILWWAIEFVYSLVSPFRHDYPIKKYFWKKKQILIAGFNHLEKYEFVNGVGTIPYMKWKIKFMFETTNQPFLKAIILRLQDLQKTIRFWPSKSDSKLQTINPWDFDDFGTYFLWFTSGIFRPTTFKFEYQKLLSRWSKKNFGR